MSAPPDFSARENALQLESSALQAIELTNQILTYSGRTLLQIDCVNLSRLVRDMEEMLKVSVPKGVGITYSLEDSLPGVNADPEILRQIISHLVVNAAESYLDRKGNITVKTGAIDCDEETLGASYLGGRLPTGKYVFLEVSDEGCGMAPTIQRRMFDPFFSTKIRGQGMGLAVVLGSARAHHGAVQVESREGKGTRIRTLFPTPKTAAAKQR